MKQLIVWVAIVAIIVFIACTHDTVNLPQNTDEDTVKYSNDVNITDDDSSVLQVVNDTASFLVSEKLRKLESEYYEGNPPATPRSNMSVFYNFQPSQSCPGEEILTFMVKDWQVDPQYAVRFIAPSGSEYFIPMHRSGNYQYVFVRIWTPGRWDWEYVLESTHQPAEPLSELYYRDMTGVEYDGSGNAEIYFPFSESTGWVLTCGHGCGAHTSGNNEYYGEDWAHVDSTLEKGFYSPLDGTVVNVDYAPSTYGNYVDVEQEVGAYTLLFRVAHLASVDVQEGDIVRAGVTKLGGVGSTGNSTGPHAHCVLFNTTNWQDNIPFNFTASCP